MAEEYERRFVGRYYVQDGSDVTDAMRAAGTFTDSDIDVEVYRVLGPRTPATRDYREERLNIIVNEHGLCERVFFG